MVHWSWILAGFALGGWYGFFVPFFARGGKRHGWFRELVDRRKQ